MHGTDMLLMRHGYDDHSYIDGKNDTSLTLNGIEVAREESTKIASHIASKYERGISLRVSSKRRAIETAEILVQELRRHGVDHAVDVDGNLRELYQGELLGLDGMTHKEKVRMLELGWEIFDKERVAGNDDYKFGTPDYSDSKYQRFNEFVKHPYGESQNDLSRRIEVAYVDALAASADKAKTPMIIAHRGTIREVLNLVATHNSGSYNIKQNPDIEMSGWKYCELFTAKIDDLEFSRGALKRYLMHGK
jgi:broad specificity phosphatase PhoE